MNVIVFMTYADTKEVILYYIHLLYQQQVEHVFCSHWTQFFQMSIIKSISIWYFITGSVAWLGRPALLNALGTHIITFQ